MNRLLIAQDGAIVINELTSDDCQSCIEKNVTNGYAHIACINDNVNKRIAYYKNSFGSIFCCSPDSKTTKLFKIQVEGLYMSIKPLCELHSKIVEESSSRASVETISRIDRVVHNLRSINAHSIQELYSIIPQEKLTNNIKETANEVKKYIIADTQRAAITFLKIAKLNNSVKAEFSVYDKLLKGNPKLDFRLHNTRDIVMIVLYPFFLDFNEINVRIDVQDYYDKTKVDFESFQVAIYHIIENASKYIMPNSSASVSFRNTPKEHIISFEMCSLYISPDEEQMIFDEGYSGDLAKKIGKAGTGIGMYRASRLMKLNQGELSFEAGEIINTIDGIHYANNKIIITVNRNN